MFTNSGWGYSEIRFSLRTGYKKQAQEYARILYGNLRELLMSEQKLDYPSIKIRLNKLLLKLMHQVDHKDRLKISFPMALPGLKPVLAYPDLSQAKERLKEVANGLLIKFEKNHVLAQLSKDGAFSKQETLKNRASILRSYPLFYTTLHSYAYAHGKSDLQQKEDLKDKVELDIGRYKKHAKENQQPRIPTSPERAQPPGTADQKLLFSQLVEQYIKTKLSDREISDSTAIDYRNRLKNFTDIAGDMPLIEIDRKNVREFRDTLGSVVTRYQPIVKYT